MSGMARSTRVVEQLVTWVSEEGGDSIANMVGAPTTKKEATRFALETRRLLLVSSRKFLMPHRRCCRLACEHSTTPALFLQVTERQSLKKFLSFETTKTTIP